MARRLTPFDAGYAALLWSVDPSDEPPEEPVFDAADWRFELGSWGAKSSPLKFDPAVCGFDPASMGFTAGWSENPR